METSSAIVSALEAILASGDSDWLQSDLIENARAAIAESKGETFHRRPARASVVRISVFEGPKK